MTSLQTPAHAGSREQAQALVVELADDLSGTAVTLDCSGITVATPSFVDEFVKQVLGARNAALLDVIAAPARTRALLELAAGNRGVADRLRFERRAA